MRFQKLAQTFKELEAITGRIRMTEILAELFKQASPSEAKTIAYLMQGELAPAFKNIRFNIAEKLAEEALARAFNSSKERVHSEFKKKGDLGIVAEALSKRSSSSLTVGGVYEKLFAIASASGTGSQEQKISLLSELLREASSLEAKYVVRMVLGQLRIGVSAFTILDALSIAVVGSKKKRGELENAYNVSADLGKVAENFLSGKTKRAEIEVFHPIKPALAQRESSTEKILSRFSPAAIEPKYDGFRVQVHKKGSRVKLFSRNLEEMTRMFPEIVEGVKKQVKAREAIFEGEALAFDEATDFFLPFQVTIQRKRKYDVEKMSKELPLKLFAFDLLYLNGKNCLNEAYSTRKNMLKKIISRGETIQIAEEKITSEASEIDKLFNAYISAGLEGILAKDPKSIYSAGARGYDWIKLKRSYKSKLADTVDVAIVGYLRGKGKRAKLGIGALIGAAYNEEKNVFETVAKIGSGLTEEQTKELKKMLDAIEVKNKPKNVVSNLEADAWCEPKYVVEVNADEITKSPVHTCCAKGGVGLSLRFPRVVGFVRADKKAFDATTSREIKKMFKGKF